jgi:isoquinoline 1-oxidoreductase beta subunit
MSMPSLDRRTFLKTSVSAGALLIAIPLAARGDTGTKALKPSAQWCVYVRIHPDNSVTMISPVSEMGQFMRTTGPMLIADEMDLDWSLVSFSREMPVLMKRNEKGEIVYDHAQIGTGGSNTVRTNWDYMRMAGATARRMLIEEAAARWHVPADGLRTASSFVIDTNNDRRLSYGALAQKGMLRRVDTARVKLKERSQYRIMGKDAGVIDIRDMVTGKPLFGIDEDYPNALQAVVDRAPALGGEIASYDKAAALAVPGVQAIVEIERNVDKHWPEGEAQIVAAGVAVLADDLWSALQGKQALKTQWKNTSPSAREDSEAQIQEFHRLVASDTPATVLKEYGELEQAIERADMVLEHAYEHPLLVHACMEPLNCIVDIRADSATVVVGHQWPHSAATEVERVTGIDALKVQVIGRRMGGGFGRRGEIDNVREAVALAHKLKRPVKVTWTRENDTEHDFFGPAAVVRIRAALKDGKITGWHHRQAQTRGNPRHISFPMGIVPSGRVEKFASTSHIPCGTWRAPLHLQWAFAAESMIDELAYAAGEDPLAFRLKLMTPEKPYAIDDWSADEIHSGRMAACYRAAAELADWGKKRPDGTGLGIAGHFTFGSYAACVLEVAVNEREELRINKAWGAIDCGFAINPNHIRAQMEGGFIDGLNAALFNKAIIKNGRVQNNNFDTLRWMRMREAPVDIEVAIIDSGYEPTGVGEPPVAPAGAALANAIYAACGKRIRRMPIAESINI